MLKDQNNPKVLSAISEVVNKSIAETRGGEQKVCALLSGRYSSFRPVLKTESLTEADLSPKQKKIAKVAGHPGKIDAADFAALRAGHKIKEDDDIVIDDELESLLEYEVVRVGGRRVNDEGESYDGKKVFGQRYSGGGSTPHAVHVNGKKWKTFSSQQHAQNVANKLVQQGKKATVHKEDIQLEDGEKLVEARFMKGQDVGKPGMNFSKIARTAAKKYGSKAAGQRVAGSILKKVLNKEEVIVENPLLALGAAGAVAARVGAALAARRAAPAAAQAAASKITPMMNASRNAATGQFRPNAPKIPDTQAFKLTVGDGLRMPTPGTHGAIRTGAATAAVGAGLGKAVLDKDSNSTPASAPAPASASAPAPAATKAEKKPMSDFDKEFAAARSRGDETFKYTPKDGKETTYTTRYKEEDDAAHKAAIAKIKGKNTKVEEFSLGESKHEMDDSKDADEHIHVQLKKAADNAKHVVPGKEGVNTKGGADVKFNDGKHFVHAEHAKKVIHALEKLRPADRAKMHAHIQQSHANFQAVHKLVS